MLSILPSLFAGPWNATPDELASLCNQHPRHEGLYPARYLFLIGMASCVGCA